MSYLTLEVDIKHGKVVAKEPGKLPESGSGFLTIFETEHPATSPLEAFRRLQREVHLTPDQAAAWKSAISDARR